MSSARVSASGFLVFWAMFGSSAAAQADDIPLAIAAMPDEVQQAWSDVQEAVAENEDLDKPLPEPYFSRAEILTAAGSYDAALQDYLKAIELACDSGDDPRAYATWLSKLAEALDNFDKAPRPAGKGNSNRHYANGVHAFWQGDTEKAIRHFGNAIHLEPAKALYWYYRALAYLKSGDQRRAKHDALIGSHLEWKDGHRDKIGDAFIRLQGPMRVWIERYRLGDPSQHLAADDE